jgi:hypothetical protein
MMVEKTERVRNPRFGGEKEETVAEVAEWEGGVMVRRAKRKQKKRKYQGTRRRLGAM